MPILTMSRSSSSLASSASAIWRAPAAAPSTSPIWCRTRSSAVWTRCRCSAALLAIGALREGVPGEGLQARPVSAHQIAGRGEADEELVQPLVGLRVLRGKPGVGRGLDVHQRLSCLTEQASGPLGVAAGIRKPGFDGGEQLVEFSERHADLEARRILIGRRDAGLNGALQAVDALQRFRQQAVCLADFVLGTTLGRPGERLLSLLESERCLL